MNATVKRLILPLAILALVVAAGFAMFSTDESKTLTAHFPRTISIYEGSEVKVLGVAIGNVDKVTPSGTDVVVEMHYDADVDLPQDATAVIVAPSIVGDRYIQITPIYESGPKLADGATLETEDTAVPLELDQIYGSLDELNVALGPNGANQQRRAHRPARDHRGQLRRPGSAVPPDDPGLQQAERDPRRQQGGAVRLRP